MVSETYYDLGSSAQVCEIKTKMCETKQKTQDVTTCYNILNRLWEKLDLFYT